MGERGDRERSGGVGDISSDWAIRGGKVGGGGSRRAVIRWIGGWGGRGGEAVR